MPGSGRFGNGNPAPGRGNGGSSGALFSLSGYNSSISAKPGASGIGPRISAQASSTIFRLTGASSIATAPAENAASLAKSDSRLGAVKTILDSPPCSLISSAAKCPSREGMSRASTTNSGSKRIYSSTAKSPSSHTSILKSFVLKISRSLYTDI